MTRLEEARNVLEHATRFLERARTHAEKVRAALGWGSIDATIRDTALEDLDQVQDWTVAAVGKVARAHELLGQLAEGQGQADGDGD
jgi:hypothetical protein